MRFTLSAVALVLTFSACNREPTEADANSAATNALANTAATAQPPALTPAVAPSSNTATTKAGNASSDVDQPDTATGGEAASLPLRDGRYVAADAPEWRGPSCDMAPMAVRAVIAEGQPMGSPQFGECQYRITRVRNNIYSVRPSCSDDNPPTATYTIVSSTEFSVRNEYGHARYRWCTGL